MTSANVREKRKTAKTAKTNHTLWLTITKMKEASGNKEFLQKLFLNASYFLCLGAGVNLPSLQIFYTEAFSFFRESLSVFIFFWFFLPFSFWLLAVD